MTRWHRFALALAGALLGAARAGAGSPLAAAGYSVLPAPRQVTLAGGEVRLDSRWRLRLDAGVAEGDVAVEALREGLAERHGLKIATVAAAAPAAGEGDQGGDGGADGPVIRLTIRPGTVTIGPAQDRDRDALATQAYRLEIGGREVRLTANAPAGLFYGVQTLVQLLTRRGGTGGAGGGLALPAGEITDWPDLQLRELFWDDAHHLERMDALRQAIRQAAFFKINGFVLKLDGHFQYRSAPALAEPQALSPEQLRQLTDYALRYHVQLIPYLDAPGHAAFILKHPEYAALRAFPDCNYEFCTANPKTYELLFGLCRDLLDANRGVKYFYLSTDEPYYVGMAGHAACDEAARQRELGTPGRVLAEFVTKAAGYLHERGRAVIFWGEYPLKPADVPALPAYLVNGETVGPEFDATFKARGIRQMFYTSTQGEEKLFPDYALLPAGRRVHPEPRPKEGAPPRRPRVAEAVETIRSGATRRDADLMGVMVAGWADAGLHPETFWLGYATITAAGWNPRDADPAEASASFYRLFYGPSAEGMGRVYELMSHQAQSWSDTWETGPSKWRKPIWGNSSEIFRPGRPARDQAVPLPPAPSPENLAGDSNWGQANADRLRAVALSLAENDELLSLLQRNARQVEFNRYNLEVFLSIAKLCRQNLHLLRGIARMDELIASAGRKAKEGRPREAVAALDEAMRLARDLRRERDEVLKDATGTWYKTWLPRVAEANGRKFLHELDDVKDHLPDRTVGMEYLVYRQLRLPFGEWVGHIQSARDTYAKANRLPASGDALEWDRLE